jgi:hypothetical protein
MGGFVLKMKTDLFYLNSEFLTNALECKAVQYNIFLLKFQTGIELLFLSKT